MQPNPNYPSNQAYGQTQPAGPQQSQQGAATFADPTIGGGNAVKIRHLEGRTVVFVPTAYNPSARGLNPTDPPRPTVTADVLVLDGGELYFGDNASEHTPNTHRVATPYYATGLLIGNSMIVEALVSAVGREVVLGRIERGTQGKKPWLLQRLEPADPARTLAAQVWAARVAGQFTNPTPIELNPQPVQQYPQPGPNPYGQQAQQQYAPASVQQHYAPTQQQYAPAAGVPVGQQPAPAGAVPMPAGWNPTVWAGFTPEQQQQIAASQPAPVAQQGPPF